MLCEAKEESVAYFSLHVTMSVLAFQATAVARVLAGETEDLRWMVRKVA